jgi:hypothetical protein
MCLRSYLVESVFVQTRSVVSERHWLRFKHDGQPYTPAEQVAAHQQYDQLIQRIRQYRRSLYDRFGDRSLKSVLEEHTEFQSPAVQWLLNYRVEDDIGGKLDDLSTIYYDSDYRLNGTDVIMPHGYDQLFHALLDLPSNSMLSGISVSVDSHATTAPLFGGVEASDIDVRLRSEVAKIEYALNSPPVQVTLGSSLHVSEFLSFKHFLIQRCSELHSYWRTFQCGCRVGYCASGCFTAIFQSGDPKEGTWHDRL